MDNQTIQILIQAKDETKKELEKANASIKNLGKQAMAVGGALTAGVTTPLVIMGKKAVESFSSLSEAVNATNVVFGEASSVVTEFAETSAEAIGMAESSFLQAASGIGATLQNMGMSANEAADATLALTERAADMASVHNTDVKQALDAISSGLRGSAEPLDRYAVNLLDAQVQGVALAEGIWDGVGAMTEEEKTLARVATIMQQTDDVAGDFANTSDGLANSARIVRAQMENLRSEIGEALAPVMQGIINIVGNVVEWFSNLSDTTKQIIAVIGLLMAVLGPLLVMLGAIAMAVTAISTPVLIVIGAVAAAIVVFIALKDVLKPIFDIIVGMLKPAFDALWKVISEELVPAFKRLWEILEPVLLPVLKVLGGVLLAGVVVPIMILVKALEILIKVVTKVAQAIADFINKTLDRWKKLINFFSDSVAWIGEIFGAVKDAIVGAFTAAFDAVKNALVSVMNWIIDKINAVIGGINTVTSKVGIPAIGTIPRLASGSDSFRGGLAVVGETGAEVVNLPRGSQVSPATGGTMSAFNNYGTINLTTAEAVDAFITKLNMDTEKEALGLTI